MVPYKVRFKSRQFRDCQPDPDTRFEEHEFSNIGNPTPQNIHVFQQLTHLQFSVSISVSIYLFQSFYLSLSNFFFYFLSFFLLSGRNCKNLFIPEKGRAWAICTCT